MSSSGGENCELMAATLLVKNSAKSSALREVDGGGEGGSMSDLKVVNSFLVSEVLLSLSW
ncbi:hypothetical protein EXN66_Car000075 [Channa argus]|uniref:Uncharacterized protein n=1 Tax=Channa argus TaxID=215402 RepID=A0A6G1QWN0_CHAAH|nr:hypothetical protein EXN66_Car000075 [Channa argus]